MSAVQDRMTRDAMLMASRLGPVDTAGILCGAAVGVLTSSLGAEAATRYLRDLADAIERNPEGRQHGHA